MRIYGFFAGVILAFFVVTGCAGHKAQVVPFKMPGAYPNATQVAGATIAAKAYDNEAAAKEAFGWDIRGAGLYPVQVVFDNLGDHSLEIEPSQTFLIDGEDNLWSILDSSLAYDRVAQKSDMSRIGKGAVLPSALWQVKTWQQRPEKGLLSGLLWGRPWEGQRLPPQEERRELPFLKTSRRSLWKTRQYSLIP
jgi:hypothetical protein